MEHLRKFISSRWDHQKFLLRSFRLQSTHRSLTFHIKVGKSHKTSKFPEISAIHAAQPVIWMVYGLDDEGSIPGRTKISFFASTTRLSLRITQGHRDLFTRKKGGRIVKLTTHLYIMPKSRTRVFRFLYVHSLYFSTGIMLNMTVFWDVAPCSLVQKGRRWSSRWWSQ
jgi:hypothetical protein